jgi:ribosome-binding protein aMBF1 (putative translation factor)
MPDGQWSLFDERPTCAHCGRRIDGPRWEARVGAAATVVVCALCAHNPEYARKRQLP